MTSIVLAPSSCVTSESRRLARARVAAAPCTKWPCRDLPAFSCDHVQPSRLAQAGIVRQCVLDRVVEDPLSRRADRTHHQGVFLMRELWWRECLTG
jgi:hypothetical protein